MAKYHGSDKPKFVTSSITHGHKPTGAWRTEDKVHPVVVRQGQPASVKLSRAEKIARDRRFGLAY